MNSNTVWFEDCVEIKNEIWYPSGIINGLFKFNTETGEISFVTCFPAEKIDGFRLFSAIYHYENKLILVPYIASQIYVYDIGNNEIHGIKVLEGDKQLLSPCIQNNSKILMTTRDKKYFILFDIKTDNYLKISIDEIQDGASERLYLLCGAYYNNRYFIGNTEDNVILVFDFISEQFEFVEINYKKTGLCVFGVWNSCLLADDMSGNIIAIDINDYHIIESYHYTINKSEKDYYCINYILKENTLFCFDLWTNQIIRLDLKTKKCTNIYLHLEEKQEVNIPLTRNWGLIKSIKEGILIITNKEGQMILMRQDGTYEIINPNFNNRDWHNTAQKIVIETSLLNNTYIHESDICGLKDFIEFVK